MSQEYQDPKKIMRLQKRETRLRSALRDKTGDPGFLSSLLRTVQATQIKLKKRVRKTHSASS